MKDLRHLKDLKIHETIHDNLTIHDAGKGFKARSLLDVEPPRSTSLGPELSVVVISWEADKV
jgi:hypothetical protein